VGGLAGLGVVSAAAGLGVVSGARLMPGQTSRRVLRVGLLRSTPFQKRARGISSWQSFLTGLLELGWVEGENVVFEWAIADPVGHVEQFPQLAADLIGRNVDVIVADEGLAVIAARNVSTEVPIVAVNLPDVVARGFAETLARPGGNVTGITQDVPGGALRLKRLELLRRMLPSMASIAVVWTSAAGEILSGFADVRDTAAGLGVRVKSFDVSHPDVDLDAVFAAAASGVDALYFLTIGFFNLMADRFVDFAASHRLPAIYFQRQFVDLGGLMSYGPNFPASWRRAAMYVDRILKGDKPAEIPIEQPTVFEFVINIATAEAFGLTMPPDVAAQVTDWVV
jgi:putative ABC transport system substrate-binding protein